jgi:hypothetical protein
MGLEVILLLCMRQVLRDSFDEGPSFFALVLRLGNGLDQLYWLL